MFVKIALLISCLVVTDAAYQQCHIVCQDDHAQPEATIGNIINIGNALKGEAGAKGEAGEKGDKGEAGDSCDCSVLDQVLEEMVIIKAELAGLKKKPRDCYEIKQSTPSAANGLYQIFPSFNAIDGYNVYCDMHTEGGGWIVFQNRQDGSEDFYRGWDDYVNGFGNLTGEFWMGLELLHKLTANRAMELRVDLADFEDNTAYEQYSEFAISEGTDYALDFGSYSGTAGVGLAKYKFSTKDNDQDTWSANCASRFFGAWWYTDCHSSNLNGLYLRGTTDQYATGMVWYPWKGHYYALKSSQMKFRPTM